MTRDPFDTLQEFVDLPFQERWGSVETDAHDALAEIKERVRELEEYAKEGWFWVDKALAASGWKTVFDIPAWEEKP